MENCRKYRCDRYGNTCEDCPIKEICFYLFDLPFGKSDTDSYLKIYDKGKADGAREFAEWLLVNHTMDCIECNSGDKSIGCKECANEYLAEWQKGEE